MSSAGKAQKLFDLIRSRATTRKMMPPGYGTRGKFSLNELQDFSVAESDLTTAHDIKVPKAFTATSLRLPAMDGHFAEMATTLEMDPYELETAVKTAMLSDHPMIIEAFKKFIMTAKLMDERVTERVAKRRHDIQQIRDEHAEEVRRALESQERQKAVSEDKEMQIANAELAIQTKWKKFAERVTDRLHGVDYNLLGDVDRWIVDVLRSYDLANLTLKAKNQHLVNIKPIRDFLKHDHQSALKLIRRMIEAQQSEERQIEARFIQQAPINELSSVMWETQNPDLRLALQSEIEQRRVVEIEQKRREYMFTNKDGEVEIHESYELLTPDELEWIEEKTRRHNSSRLW